MLVSLNASLNIYSVNASLNTSLNASLNTSLNVSLNASLNASLILKFDDSHTTHNIKKTAVACLKKASQFNN